MYHPPHWSVFWPLYPVTTLLFLFNSVIFAGIKLGFMPPFIIYPGIFNISAFLGHFTHLEIWHFAFNNLALLFVGPFALTGTQYRMAIPQGTIYVPGSLAFNGTSQPDTVISTERGIGFIDLQDSNFVPGETNVVTFDVTLSSSPLYVISSSMVFELDQTTAEATYVTEFTNHMTASLGLSSDASKLYSIDYYDLPNRKRRNLVRELDLMTGLQRDIGQFAYETNTYSTPCLDVHPNGNLFTVDSKAELALEIDINNGQIVKSTPLNGVNIQGGDCAFNSNQILYYVTNINSLPTLFEINITTGEATQLGPLFGDETGKYVPGLALGSDSRLWAWEVNSHQLQELNNSTGVATGIGNEAYPTRGIDLAQSARQILDIVIYATYTDDQGNSEVYRVKKAEVVGAPISVTNPEAPIPDDSNFCKHVPTQTCDFPTVFRDDMLVSLETIMVHHRSEFNKNAEAESEVRNLTGADLDNFLRSANNILLADLSVWQSEAEAIIDNWIASYQGEPFCPHRSELYKALKSKITELEAQTSRKIREIGTAGTAPNCFVNASHRIVQSGDDVFVGWSGRNGESYQFTNPSYFGSPTEDGVLKFNPIESTVIEMSVLDENGDYLYNCAYPVDVEIKCALEVQSCAVEENVTTQMFYSKSAGTTAEIDYGIGVVTGDTGVVNIAPAFDTTYTMTVTNGTDTRNCQLEVKTFPAGQVPVCADVE